jgi:hypothetical protein
MAGVRAALSLAFLNFVQQRVTRTKVLMPATSYAPTLGNIIYWTVNTSQTQRRQLNTKESKALQKIKSTAEKDIKRGHKIHFLFIAAVLGVICVFLANWTTYDSLKFVFGTISVLSFGFVVFMPYEIHKGIKKAKKKIKAIDGILAQDGVDVSIVNASRIAVAKEFEDEGDLYIVETINKDILYLWDNDYNLKKNFPCLEFEIYSEDFYKIIGRQINPLSEKINPITIDAKNKWAYLKKVGGPGHLTLEKRDFEEVLEQINNVA